MLAFLIRSFFRPALAARSLVCVLAGAGLLLAACSDDTYEPQPSVPSLFLFTQPDLYPDGLQYDPSSKRFLVSSLTRGVLGQVQNTGLYNVFNNNAALVSTFGVYLDNTASRNRVLTAIADSGYNDTYNTALTNASAPTTRNRLAAVAVINRAVNPVAFNYLRLDSIRGATAPAHFANDVTVDAAGNAYVTDSFAPIIYKINPAATQATVFLRDNRLAGATGTTGLNGIVYHPDGYLLVGKTDTGTLLKIPLSNPTAFTTVTLNLGGNGLGRADGLFLQDNNSLAIVNNFKPARVYNLQTTDNWASASATRKFDVPEGSYPTTLTRRDNDLFVLCAGRGTVGSATPRREFEIRKVVFEGL